MEDAVQARKRVLKLLEQNQLRREAARQEQAEAQRELVELLKLGRELGYRMKELTERAKLSPAMAHRYLKR